MPNRTIYLPQELDELSRRLDLNLSQVVQRAIREIQAEGDRRDVDGEIAAAMSRAERLGIDWSDHSLSDSRDEAGER